MRQLMTYLDRDNGRNLLTTALAKLYDGGLSLPPAPDDRPYIALNFVRTIDGIITFGIPGKEGGGEISRRNPQDTFVMGMLRAAFGNMAEGANAVRKNPKHLWTPGFISPEHSNLYRECRQKINEPEIYRTFFFTGSGNLKPEVKPGLPPPPQVPKVFTTADTEPWVMTTESGKATVLRDFPPDEFPSLCDRVIAFGRGTEVDVKAALEYMRKVIGIEYLLIEGGARFAGSVIGVRLYDELFLSESDIIAGNSDQDRRLTFVWDALFTPEDAPRHKLISLKTDGGDVIFERRRRI